VAGEQPQPGKKGKTEQYFRAAVVAHVELDGQEPATFAAIGARLGVTRQRAHQFYCDALHRVAHPARERSARAPATAVRAHAPGARSGPPGPFPPVPRPLCRHPLRKPDHLSI
jgi:hypothetical protein